MIEICAVGGYNEVGKNMTAIKIDDEVIICDMGIHLESYIKYTQDEDLILIKPDELIKVGAAPDISKIGAWKDKVKAIIPTHAHLDHVGAIPYLSNRFNAEIICTPFTAEVIKAIVRDEKIKLKNKIKELNPNSHLKISENIRIEFVNMTHSTPQTIMLAIHTKYGTIVYANDFKFDRSPVLGKKPDFKRLKEMGKSNVIALIVDSTYAEVNQKTPSESVAKEMLKDVLLGTDSKDKVIIITTFSSHLARLKSIIELGKKLNRKIVFCGRSLGKYVEAGESAGIISFSKDIEILKYRNQIRKGLNKISKKGKRKYLLVVTGHQGEPNSVLSRIVDKQFDFRIDVEDHVIFSCKTIPCAINIESRAVLEEKLKHARARIFKDIHVSGHAAREDLRDLINMLQPELVIPAHGNSKMKYALADLARELGYRDDQIIMLRDGEKSIIS